MEVERWHIEHCCVAIKTCALKNGILEERTREKRAQAQWIQNNCPAKKRSRQDIESGEDATGLRRTSSGDAKGYRVQAKHFAEQAGR